jgi:hypothetical protein
MKQGTRTDLALIDSMSQPEAAKTKTSSHLKTEDVCGFENARRLTIWNHSKAPVLAPFDEGRNCRQVGGLAPLSNVG